jgi:hypothetical protein
VIMADFLVVFKDFGFPAIVSLGLLYILGFKIEEQTKALTAKMDIIIANQTRILENVSAIRGSQIDSIAEKGRSQR